MKYLLKHVPNLLMITTIILSFGIFTYLTSLVLHVTGWADMSFLLSPETHHSEYPIPLVIGILVTKGFLLITLSLLLKVLIDLKNNAPFERHIIKRFYVIGIIVFIIPLLNFLPYLFNSFLGTPPWWDFYAVDTFVNRTVGSVITAILILAFAHVLNSGLSIYEEQQLTI